MEASRLQLSGSFRSGEVSHGAINGHRGPPATVVSPTTQGQLGPLLDLNVRDYVRLLVCTGCGFVFGIAAEKARGSLPQQVQL